MQSGGHIFHVTALHHKSLIGDGKAVFRKGFFASAIDGFFQSLAAGGDNVLGDARIHQSLFCLIHGKDSFGKLSIQEFLTAANRQLLGFRPMGTVIAHKVGSIGIDHFSGILLCQHLGLSNIREVFGAQAVALVVLLRGDVSCLLLDSAIELLGAVPNGHQFLLLKRRGAFFRFIHKALEGGISITVLFDDATGKSGHGGITTALCDDLGCAEARLTHSGIKLSSGKKLSKGHKAIKHLNLCIRRAEVETGCIQGFGIEIRENGTEQLFKSGIFLGIGYRVYGEKSMELRSGGSAVFDLHVVTAVMDSKLHTWERIGNVIWGFPVSRVIGVVVIAFHGQAIAAEEVIIAAVETFVFSTDIVLADCQFQTVGVGDFNFIRIQAVARLSDTICVVKSEHQ